MIDTMLIVTRKKYNLDNHHLNPNVDPLYYCIPAHLHLKQLKTRMTRLYV